jgi:hypothetical protein
MPARDGANYLRAEATALQYRRSALIEERPEMFRMIRVAVALLAAFTLHAVAPGPIGGAEAKAAVVYCKTAGVPKGCVVRPTTVVVYCTSPGLPAGCVVRPTAVIYCTAPGVPLGCVARPVNRVVVAPVVAAPRAVGAPGYPGNRGGPVNRVGRR